MVRLIILAATAAWLLIACATPPAPPQSSVEQAAIRATQAAWAYANSQATLAAAENSATAAAAQATHTVQAATAAAMATVEAEALATQSVATAASQALDIRERELALEGTAQMMAVQVSEAQTAVAMRAANVAVMQTATAREVERNQRREDIDLQLRQTLVNLVPTFLVFILLIIPVTVVAVLYILNQREERQRTPLQVNHEGVPVTLLPDGRGGFRMLPPRQPALLTAGPPMIEDVPRPNWAALLKLRRLGDPEYDLKAPIGVTIPHNPGERPTPIFIDRTREPHLFIAGTTGSGKSSSILLPYTADMIALGMHALVINGRGIDFRPLEGVGNATVLPPIRRECWPMVLENVLGALVAEIDRRDIVLRRYGARNWCELPPRAGQPGEIVVTIDELLSIVLELEAMAAEASGADKKRLEHIVRHVWRGLIIVTSEARKYGVFAVATMTDPTERNLGKPGMTVRSQMAKICLSMKSADASRKLLDLPQGSPFKSGSAGLPQGQFIANVLGRIYHGVAFHPSGRDIQELLETRPIAPNALPDGIRQAIDDLDRNWFMTDEDEGGDSVVLPGYTNGAPATLPNGELMTYARRLDDVIYSLGSLNAVGRFLHPDLDVDNTTDRPAGHFLDDVVKPVLELRVKHMNCRYARRLLERAVKSN